MRPRRRSCSSCCGSPGALPAVVYCGRRATCEQVRRPAAGRGRLGLRRTTPAWRQDARSETLEASWPADRRGRGHHRVRHGHRQGRRALGGALGAARLAGGVLPAGGPRRPRRAAGPLHAALQPARQGPDRVLHQPREDVAGRPGRPLHAGLASRADARGGVRGVRARRAGRGSARGAGRARAGRCAGRLPGAGRLLLGQVGRPAAGHAPPERGGGRHAPGREPAVGAAEGDRRLRDRRRLPARGTARLLRRAPRGTAGGRLLRRPRRAPGDARGAGRDAGAGHGRRRAAGRRRDRRPRRPHTPGADPARIPAPRRWSRPATTGCAATARSSASRRPR